MSRFCHLARLRYSLRLCVCVTIWLGTIFSMSGFLSILVQYVCKCNLCFGAIFTDTQLNKRIWYWLWRWSVMNKHFCLGIFFSMSLFARIRLSGVWLFHVVKFRRREISYILLGTCNFGCSYAFVRKMHTKLHINVLLLKCIFSIIQLWWITIP